MALTIHSIRDITPLDGLLRGWTEAEDAYLAKHYRTKRAKVIAYDLGRTRDAVVARAKIKGLYRWKLDKVTGKKVQE